MMDERKDARTDGRTDRRTWATLNALPHSTNSGGIKIIMNLDYWFRRRFPLKIFLIWSSGRPHYSAEWNHLCNFVLGYQEEQYCEVILNLDLSLRRCHLKYFYLELWQPSCSVEPDHLCNFERGHHGEHSCEVI